MDYFHLLTICFTLGYMHDVAVVKAATMDEIIAGSAETLQDFNFFQGTEENPIIKVELDMLFTPMQWQEIQLAAGTYGDESGIASRERRKAIRKSTYRWPKGVIPYELARGVFTSPQRSQIMSALNEWQTYTCITFKQAQSSDRDRIRFNNGGGCYSNVGKIGGSQTVGLAPGCRYKGVIVHEIGHAVGFQHEQTRPDRDDYVQIIRGNISPRLYYNFQKYSVSSVNNYNVPYDYTSIMHYGSKAFSVNGGLTIKTRDPKYQSVIGNRNGMSFRDIKLANIMYQCNARCNKNVKCPGEGFVDKSCQCMCPGNPIRKCSGSKVITTTPGSGSKTTTIKTGTGNECKDTHTSCSGWAKRGECPKYPSFMKTYCKKSCNLCKEVKETCKDTRKHCAYWQTKGYCRSAYVSYMRTNCPKSCNSCGSVDTDLGVIDTGAGSGNSSSGAQTNDNDDNSGAVTSLPVLLNVIVMVVSAVLFH